MRVRILKKRTTASYTYLVSSVCCRFMLLISVVVWSVVSCAAQFGAGVQARRAGGRGRKILRRGRAPATRSVASLFCMSFLRCSARVNDRVCRVFVMQSTSTRWATCCATWRPVHSYSSSLFVRFCLCGVCISLCFFVDILWRCALSLLHAHAHRQDAGAEGGRYEQSAG